MIVTGGSRHLGAVRRTALAACLVAALATTDARAADSRAVMAEPSLARIDLPFPLVTPLAWLGLAGIHAKEPVPFSAAPAHVAADITVSSCGDAGPNTLRQAFADAQANFVIDFDPSLSCSTITLQTGAITTNASNITLQGPGRDRLTIDGNYASSVLRANGNLSIRDITIANGTNDTGPTAGFGGCVFTFGNLSLTGSTVTGCHENVNVGGAGGGKAYGGAVCVIGNLIMDSSTISDSEAAASYEVFGGGAFASGYATLLNNSTIVDTFAVSTLKFARGGGLAASGVVQVVNSRVVGNTVASAQNVALGGGIYSNGLDVEVQASRIDGNKALSQAYASYGGGIAGGTSATQITIVNSTLSDNVAYSNCTACAIHGGGASSHGPILALYSTISGNSAFAHEGAFSEVSGGGLFSAGLGDNGEVFLENSTVSGNRALADESSGGLGFGGGVVSGPDSPFRVYSSTIAFNEASRLGGGLVGSAGAGPSPVLYDSIVAMNVAPNAADISRNIGANVFTIQGDHNLVMSAGSGIFLPGDTLQSDPLLFPLTNNGGPTATHQLASCSPAISGGSNHLGDQFDQRGNPYGREFGTAPDIGAFEFQLDADSIFRNGFELIPNCQ